MWKLIYYEFKKLLKSKSGCFMFLVFLVILGYQCKTDINSASTMFSAEASYIIEAQQKAEGPYATLFERLQLPDKETDEKKRNPNRELSENDMSMMYGADWQKLMHAYEAKTLTFDVWKTYTIHDTNISDADLKQEYEVFELQYRYEDDVNLSEFMYTLPDIKKLTHRDQFLYNTGNKESEKECVSGVCKNVTDEVSRNEINRRFIALDDTYQPTYTANVVLNQSSYTNILMLICMAILFANLYSKEHANKTELYLVTTENGGKKTLFAKLCVAMIIGVCIPLLVRCFSIIFVIMQYGNFHWNMPYFLQDIEMFPNYVFSYKELIIYSLINYMIGLSSLCVCFMCISKFCRHPYGAAIIALLFVMLPLYYGSFAIGGVHIENWLPGNLLTRFNEYFSIQQQIGSDMIQHTPFINIFNQNMPSIISYWLVWIVLSIIMIAGMAKDCKQHKIYHA